MFFRSGYLLCCTRSLPLANLWRHAQNHLWTNFPKKSLVKEIQTRTITAFPKSVKKMNIRDKVPEDYKLIYYGRLNNYTLLSQCLALFSSFTVTMFTVYNIYSGEQKEPLKLSSKDVLHFYRSIDDLIALNCLAVIMGCLVIYISRKCTLRVYHNPLKNNYVAVFPSAVPFKTFKINFNKAIKDNSFSIILKDVTYKLGTKKAFLLDYYFRSPIDLTEMLHETSKP